MSSTDLTNLQIDRITERATKFLSAASQVPSIRARLDQGGYSASEHQEGWDLLLAVLGYRGQAEPSVPTAEIRQRQATAELDQWDGPAFDRARAALSRRFPAQAAYVFEGLTAKAGPEAIGAVRTFVDRVAALRSGSDPQRAATRADDARAAALLAERRVLDEQEEARLRGLIDEATRIADLPALGSEPDPSSRQKAARALEAWLADWRGTARALITRRDHQIRLGLAERRSAKAAAPSREDADAVESDDDYAES